MGLGDHQKDLNRMIKRYIAGEANAEEKLFIETYYEHLAKEDYILHTFKQEDLNSLEQENYESILANINQKQNTKSAIPIYKYIAAAILFIAFVSGYLYLSKDRVIVQKTLVVKKEKIDVLPGIDKAILTLSDGSSIVLDDTKNENIVVKEGLIISKTTNGQLLYKATSELPKTTTTPTAYNTIATSKGNQYQILLPDGTKVWLNAASSLRYPEVFTGNVRKVTLTGEAYFEVAKNSAMPFRVQSKNQDVQVIGTHFNINGYTDNTSIKTTLLEGSIKVSNGVSTKILNPGEQSLTEIDGLGNINILKNIDTDGEIAWKNGLFSFNNAELKSVLKQLERWYDIKVDYKTVPNKRYNGMVPRKAKLSEVLNMLELTGNISFKIEEGKKLIVLPK